MALSRSLFPSDTEVILNPHFTRTLKGFSVAEVDSYVEQTARLIETLEMRLDKALRERDHLRQELTSVKTAAYRSAGERLAGILQSIDDHVNGVRRQAEEDARRRIAEAQENAREKIVVAERDAEELKRQAGEEGARTRAEAARILREAEEEAGRVLGELTERRDVVRAEIEGLRGLLMSLLERLNAPSDEAATVPQAVDALPDGDAPPDVARDDDPDPGSEAQATIVDAADADEGDDRSPESPARDADDGAYAERPHPVDTQVIDLRDIEVD